MLFRSDYVVAHELAHLVHHDTWTSLALQILTLTAAWHERKEMRHGDSMMRFLERAAAAGPKTELRNKAWQLAGGYVLTGENSAFGGVVPASNFDPAAGTWGAFEVVARYANLDVDDNAFPTLAAPATSANAAKSSAVGVNWYLSKAVRASFDYYHTRFTLPAGAPAVSSTPFLRQNEQAFITRFQLTFCPEPNAVSVL